MLQLYVISCDLHFVLFNVFLSWRSFCDCWLKCNLWRHVAASNNIISFSSYSRLHTSGQASVIVEDRWNNREQTLDVSWMCYQTSKRQSQTSPSSHPRGLEVHASCEYHLSWEASPFFDPYGIPKKVRSPSSVVSQAWPKQHVSVALKRLKCAKATVDLEWDATGPVTAVTRWTWASDNPPAIMPSKPAPKGPTILAVAPMATPGGQKKWSVSRDQTRQPPANVAFWTALVPILPSWKGETARGAV